MKTANVITEVVIVSTDIDAPKATAFAMVHGADVGCRHRHDEPTGALDV